MRKHQPDTFTVLQENPRFIAVSKPSGLEIVPDPRSDRARTLAGMVENHTGGKARDVYRIETEASGLVLFARTAEVFQDLCRQFDEGTLRERHLALVSGVVQEDTGAIERPADPREKKHFGAAVPLALFTVVERFRNFTLLALEPKNGSWVQLRIHLRVFGHPLAVDREYHSREGLFMSEFKHNYKHTGKERPLIGRLSLHSAGATFEDPGTKQPVTIEAPLPDDFQLALKMLGKYNR